MFRITNIHKANRASLVLEFVYLRVIVVDLLHGQIILIKPFNLIFIGIIIYWLKFSAAHSLVDSLQIGDETLGLLLESVDFV